MKTGFKKFAAAVLGMAYVTAQAQSSAPLYGKEAVDFYNKAVQLHLQVAQEAVRLYSQCMDLRLENARRGAPDAPCTAPFIPPLPPLQWSDTDPRKEQK